MYSHFKKEEREIANKNMKKKIVPLNSLKISS